MSRRVLALALALAVAFLLPAVGEIVRPIGSSTACCAEQDGNPVCPHCPAPAAGTQSACCLNVCALAPFFLPNALCFPRRATISPSYGEVRWTTRCEPPLSPPPEAA